MDKFGKMIREARIKKKKTIKQVAKALDCSEGYTRSLETVKHVPASKRVLGVLAATLGLKKSILDRIAVSRNIYSRKYYQKSRAKNA